MKCLYAAAIMILLWTTAARGQDAEFFPFVLPWDDASPGVTHLGHWLDAPAGKNGFVTPRDGHFFVGEKRIRFFGVNLCFGANFPTHADADKVAARMAKFGINCVRFHHMDFYPTPRGLLAADMKTLDPQQLNKLDYFIAALKKHGIYSNLNLHVSRVYPEIPAWEKAPSFHKGLDLFYEPMIDAQKDYACQLLTHVNPYTKTTYASEPAVAIVEINNENGLLNEWWNGHLDAMPPAYADALATKWQAWLMKKYDSDAALRTAWAVGESKIGSPMFDNGDFSKGEINWQFETHGSAKASFDASSGVGKINVATTSSKGWHVQLSRTQLSLKAGQNYVIELKIKADKPRRLDVGLMQSKVPWKSIGQAQVRVGTETQTIRHVFTPLADEPDARFTLSGFADETGTVEIDDIVVRPGGRLGLGDDETRASAWPWEKSAYNDRTIEAQRDWIAFLLETETAYWTHMRDFLKNDLGSKSVIVGTAAGFSPSSVQANMDAVDVHGYWNHPNFPKADWSETDWTVGTQSLAGNGDGHVLSDMALRRVAGKPLICTEFNAAAPNTFSSEAFLLLSAYAGLQDWDGLFLFAWSHTGQWDTQKISGFFDIDQHPTKLVTLPAAAAMFLRGDVAAGGTPVTNTVYSYDGVERSMRSGSWWAASVPPSVSLQHAVAMNFDNLAVHNEIIPLAPGPKTVSVTKQLTWDTSGKAFTLESECSMSYVGQLPAGPIHLSGVVIDFGRNIQNWAAFSATTMDGKDFKSAGRVLVTATGWAQNTGMQWTSDARNSVGKNWGEAPSIVEGIPATITFPLPAQRVKVWSLDERGQRRDAVPVSGDQATFNIGSEWKTLWYEVEVQ